MLVQMWTYWWLAETLTASILSCRLGCRGPKHKLFLESDYRHSFVTTSKWKHNTKIIRRRAVAAWTQERFRRVRLSIRSCMRWDTKVSTGGGPTQTQGEQANSTQKCLCRMKSVAAKKPSCCGVTVLTTPPTCHLISLCCYYSYP